MIESEPTVPGAKLCAKHTPPVFKQLTVQGYVLSAVGEGEKRRAGVETS